MKQQKFQVQIKTTVVMSREIVAKDMAEALSIATAMANREENGVQAQKGWAYEYADNSTVQGVWQ